MVTVATEPRAETSQIYFSSLITEADILFQYFWNYGKKSSKNPSGNFRFDFWHPDFDYA